MQVPIFLVLRTVGILAGFSILVGSLQPGEKTMKSRVAFVQQSSLGERSCEGCLKLGRLPDGIWEMIPDDVFLALCASKPPARLLYFSESEYQSAIRGLSPQEVARVIRKRLDEWSQNALNDAPDRIYRLEDTCLTLAVGCWHVEASSEQRRLLEEHFVEGLGFLASLVGEGRYDGLTLQQMLVLALRKTAEYLSELLVAHDSFAPGDLTKAMVDALVQTARAHASILQSMLREMGNGEFGESLPFVALERVLYVAPGNPVLKQKLVARRIDFVDWRDGVVAPWPLDGIQSLRNSGKSVMILYWNSGEFSADLVSLTKSQLQRELAARVGKRGSSAIVKQHLRSLRLEEHLLLRNTLEHSRNVLNPVAIKLQDLVNHDGQGLLREMATILRDRSNGVAATQDSLSGLQQAELEILRDASFIRKWAAQEERKSVEHRFEEIVKRKRIDSERIFTMTMHQNHDR